MYSDEYYKNVAPIKDLYNEIWKPYWREQDKWKETQKFEISNYGRARSMKHKTPILVKHHLTSGYPALTGIKCTDGKNRSFYIHHAVAELFLPPKTPEQDRIMRLDFNKENNVFTNLRWATKEEWLAHQKNHPNRKLHKPSYAKLTEMDVAIIKKKLFDPNRKTRIKMLAKRFGVSEMQLYRIKSGENWGHVRPAK